MNFIALYEENLNCKTWINMDLVTEFIKIPNCDYTTLYFLGDNSTDVQETPEEIMFKMRQNEQE